MPKYKLFLFDADYITEGNRSKIRLFCKDEKGNTIVCIDESYKPYFYILAKNKKVVLKKLKQIGERFPIDKIESVTKKLNGKKQELMKVTCKLYTDVSKIRDEIKKLEKEEGGSGAVIEEYEYSISFYKKYLMDNKISGLEWIEVEGMPENQKGYAAKNVIRIKTIKKLRSRKNTKLRSLAFDIESLEEGGKNKIIMVSLFSKNFRKVITYKKAKYQKFVEVVKDEKELLKKFVEYINIYDPDFLISYNGDEFDFQILRERADEYPDVSLILSRDFSRMKFARRARISTAKLKGRVHVDIFVFINNILSQQLQTEVLTLDSVSSELLGDKKIEMQLEDILEAWRKKKDLSKLAEYNLKDSELTYRLFEMLFPQIEELSKLVGQLPFDVSRMTYSQLVEWYLSRRAKEMNYVIPNQPKWEEVQERRKRKSYVGGYVKEPIGGIHENIAVVDFRSLYPSIIATFNISPETLKCCEKKNSYIVPEKDYWFCKKPVGFVSCVIKDLIEERKRIKEDMKKISRNSDKWKKLNYIQFALKTVSNSTYGYFGFAGSKWYCIECGEAAAAFGRYWIKKTIEKAEENGFYVLYADTDSCFLKLKEGNDIKKKVESFVKKINRWLPGYMELDLQGFYKRGIFIPRGIGPGTAKKRYALIDERGKLLIRGLEKVRRDWCELAKTVQEKVLLYILRDNDIDSAVKYTKNIIDKLKKRKVDLRDLIIHEQLTKPLEEYKAIGPHVIAAKKIRERGRPYGPGMIVMFVITKGKGSISERAEPVEDVKINDIDTSYYIHHQILPAAMRILKVLGISESDILETGLKRYLLRR